MDKNIKVIIAAINAWLPRRDSGFFFLFAAGIFENRGAVLPFPRLLYEGGQGKLQLSLRICPLPRLLGEIQ